MKTHEYYKLMESFNKDMPFKEIKDKWLECFIYILQSFDAGFSLRSMYALFYRWDMDNWKVMWLENSEYKGYSKDKLKESFCAECFYISDRTSYDRLFRTHWLFRRAFNDELMAL